MHQRAGTTLSAVDGIEALSVDWGLCNKIHVTTGKSQAPVNFSLVFACFSTSFNGSYRSTCQARRPVLFARYSYITPVRRRAAHLLSRASYLPQGHAFKQFYIRLLGFCDIHWPLLRPTHMYEGIYKVTCSSFPLP